MNLREQVKEVLANTHLMSLATSDENGAWATDVIFVYDDELNLYWMSDPDYRHSRAILKNNQVAGTITMSTKSKEPNFGIQFSGMAEKIGGSRYDLALKHYTKRGRSAPAESDDVLQGDSWYKLTPNKLCLIDEANFGYERQDILP
ncbi:MAG: pyridoxamine 5'-phosphate oxidase family protein [bacterium]|nr:pyridoxamine 5'-phosphate oxidase family protein [bacterium]